MISPRIPSGVLELLPREQIAFDRMRDQARHAFEAYGFVPISTPGFELTDLLLTKTGGETERQVYFVESAGALANPKSDEKRYPDLALPFDLTVPTARYTAQYERELAFPFRRYQMQKVYRGERAQRGRYREFMQCDIDIIGKDQLNVRYDAEPVAVAVEVYRRLDLGGFTVWINNRKLLRGFLASLGLDDAEQQTLVLREVDKVDKIGVEKLRVSLAGLGVDGQTSEQIIALMGDGPVTWADAQPKLVDLGGRDETLDAGIDELCTVAETLTAMGVPQDNWKINFALARGLDYYTGTIYEGRLDDFPQLGSVGGGGRYENLAGNYTKSKLPGVGYSIGLTRLFWQLRDAGQIKPASTVDLLLTLMDDSLLSASLSLAAELRRAGLNVETTLTAGKLAKQFKYADKAGIRFVGVLGDDEVAKSALTVKDLASGESMILSTRSAVEIVSQLCSRV